jgi:arsenate reductase (thioredoxin)
MLQPLISIIESLNTVQISEERKAVLSPLREYVKRRLTDGRAIRLQFICTHNSRRSHLGQLWAHAMSTYFNLPNVHCYSGGTEETAVFSQTLETIKAHGFDVVALTDSANPIYAIRCSTSDRPSIAFSKRYDHPFNPKSAFAAIMTCDSADDACPFVAGADGRFAIKYEDPKVSDNTSAMVQTYHERSLEIAREMKYIFEI